MKVLGIIPARAGSKRVPRKNLQLLGGKPLVAWAIELGRGVATIDRLVVSSDDDEVLTIAAGYDAALPLRRPAELAGDTSPAIDYVRHALAAAGDGADAICILQPTSPLTVPSDVEATLALLAASGAESAVTVVKLDHAIHPAKLKTLAGDRLLPYLEDEAGRMAEHELPALYVRNGAVYATRRDVLARGRILGDDCRAHVMPRARSIDINDELDLRFAEFLLARPAP